MKKSVTIGRKEYRYKKDVITHYRGILNSYAFGQSLSKTDFNDLIDLLDYDYSNSLLDLELTLNKIEYEVDEVAEINESNETMRTKF